MMPKVETVEDFYFFKFGAMWRYCKTQHYSFWMICGYLFFEFVRPQALLPAIDILPWAQLFLLGALAGAMMDPTVKWVSSFANKLIISFFIAIIISTFAALYPDISKKHFMDFFGWFVIYFLIINIVNTKERFYIFLIIFMLAAGKIAFGTSKSWAMRGFSFTSWGLMGPKGYFQNSGELAILMLMLFPIAFFLYQALKQKVKSWERWVLILFWACPILTILGASSRGAQIGLAFQLLIIFRKSIIKPKTFIGVVLLCFALFHLLPAEQKDRFSQTGEDKTSQQRLLYWQRGWEMMKEYPLTGVGFFNFARNFEVRYSEDMLYEYAQLPHNIFIQVGTDVGFIGLFIFMLLIFYCLIVPYGLAFNKNLTDLEKAWASGLGMGVLGFAIAGQFVTVTYYPFFWIHLALITALSQIYKKAGANLNASRADQPSLR